MASGEMCRGREQPLGKMGETLFLNRKMKKHFGAEADLVDIRPH
jgi:hypothetical protein